jgi:ubiquinone/menaquinone biosynthesis C-methylase UbiE
MKINIEEEAQKFYAKHYPYASEKEMDKQIKDWQNKIKAGEGLADFFSERVGRLAGKKILDVGFGSGGVSAAFSLAGAVVWGVDVEPDLKDIAERNVAANGGKADLKIYDGKKLPFDDNFFDYVICCSVLEHMTFPQEVLKEMFRVLKPKGGILLTLPNKYYPKETHTLAYFVSWMPRKLGNAYLKILKHSPLEYDNLHFYSYFDIVKMLGKTGYRYELLYKKSDQTSAPKKFLISALKKLGIHYTVLLKQLIFVIEKK